MDINHLNKLILQLQLDLPKLDNHSITQELEVIRAIINTNDESFIVNHVTVDGNTPNKIRVIT